MRTKVPFKLVGTLRLVSFHAGGLDSRSPPYCLFGFVHPLATQCVHESWVMGIGPIHVWLMSETERFPHNVSIWQVLLIAAV